MTQETTINNDKLMETTKDIVSAYVGKNACTADSVSGLIKSVYSTLASLSPEPKEEAATPVPAVAIKKSITPEYIICLENGKKFKSLKRHLKTHYDMSPEEYREKWGASWRLPDGGAELRRSAIRACKKDGSGHAFTW